MSKNLGRDYVVMPLQGLWWADDMTAFTTRRDKSTWHWTLLNLLPDWITPEHVDAARAVVAAKGAAPSTAVRLEVLDEGLCVQTMHLAHIEACATSCTTSSCPQHGLSLHGRHHEIYLGDVRRTAAERLRTILRQPVQRP